MAKLLKHLQKKDVLFIVISVILIVIGVWLELKMPDYTARLTTAVSSGGVQMSDVWENGALMLLCALGSLLSSFLCGFFVARVASNLAKNVRSSLFDKISSFSSAQMKEFTTSSLITRTTNDVTQVQNFVAMGLQMLIKAPITAVWAICKISASSFEWTLATLICVLVIVVSVLVIVLLCYKKFNRIQKLIDNVNSVTRENVSGVRVVRAFNAQNYQQKKFEKANSELTANQLYTAKATGLMQPVMQMGMHGLTLSIYWIGAYLINNAVLQNRATIIGNMTSFTQYALQVVMSFMMLIVIFILLPRVIVSVKRINEVLNKKLSIESGNQIESPELSNNKIEFKNVSFKYFDGDQEVVSNITFSVKKGETVALIGATGSGKTTIIDLIPRYNDVLSGEILVDGINVKDYNLESLHKKIAVVSQKAVLFKGDVKSNITYGEENVDDNDPRIKRAINIAKAQFVYNLPQNIHAPVAQNGSNFSGGQKQRLSIARAIFKDPEILIFDDSFSALDYKTDKQVRENIKNELIGKTILIIAQRIGTIRGADKIIVIDNGTIAAIGKHENLINSCPLYKEIALSQLSEEEI